MKLLLFACTSESVTGFGGPGGTLLAGTVLMGEDKTSRFDRLMNPALENLVLLAGVSDMTGERIGWAFESSGGTGGGETGGSDGTMGVCTAGAEAEAFSLPLSLSKTLMPELKAAGESESRLVVCFVDQPESAVPHVVVPDKPKESNAS